MPDVLAYPLDKLKEAIYKWLILENPDIVDVITAVYVANKFEADPLWLLLIAPPSNAKTELLRGFRRPQGCLFHQQRYTIHAGEWTENQWLASKSPPFCPS